MGGQSYKENNLGLGGRLGNECISCIRPCTCMSNCYMCIKRISKRSLRGTAPAVPKLELHMQAFYAVHINFRLEGELHAKNYFQLGLFTDSHTGDMCQVKIY